MKSPRLKSPKEDGLIFNSTQAIKKLNVAPATFYRHVRLLGLSPRRKARTNERFWDYDTLMGLLNSIYPRIEDRLALFWQLNKSNRIDKEGGRK